MKSDAQILQIVPHQPGTHDGVGDYALTLARRLRADFGLTSTFLVTNGAKAQSLGGFNLLSGLEAPGGFEHVILHYANYGYQARGVPVALRDFAQRYRRRLPGRWITMFHELYASGPPWRSAFWVRPFQVKVAQALMDLSDACVVSNQVIADEIHGHDPAMRVEVRPIMSNFGEPEPSLSPRSARNWVIGGGTALIERSLRSFLQVRSRIPSHFTPNQLDLIGGRENPAVRELLQGLRRSNSGPQINYQPEIDAESASAILLRASFGWLDYFGNGKVWPGMILKSGSFAAFSAHGVIPICAHQENKLGLAGDFLPGPFYVAAGAERFPHPEEMEETRESLRAWYHRHASSQQTARVYAELLT